ncbi:MAG: TolC family protein [Nitrosomonadales bacterium]|nr:TolC family protein [Nitrosomonadales bacterium]
MALFECTLLVWPLQARASLDLFATQRYAASGPFASTSEVCPKDRIQQPLALTDVIELALCNNPQTHALWAVSRAQAAQLGASLSSYLPTFSGPISVLNNRNLTAETSTSTRSIRVDISYLLYDFGGREAGVESAKQLLVAANATRDATLQSVYLNAVQSYYTLLAARASVQAYQSAETAAERSLEAAKARQQAGSGTPRRPLAGTNRIVAGDAEPYPRRRRFGHRARRTGQRHGFRCDAAIRTGAGGRARYGRSGGAGHRQVDRRGATQPPRFAGSGRADQSSGSEFGRHEGGWIAEH